MTTVYREFIVEAGVNQVWDALRDFGAVHRRLAPGFVTDCRLEEDTRVVTFASGLVARELLVGLDESARRLCYSAVGGKATHHQASAQVFAEAEDRTRFVWITDVLPAELAGFIDAMMAQGIEVMKHTLAHRMPAGSGRQNDAPQAG
ncbi:SRPBCC family protein [Polaromonas sp.]|uniref:SRPBCC family protein n=1 Tax=Polaromonas sp. TaxID=1869339 RepID=UPI0032641DA3